MGSQIQWVHSYVTTDKVYCVYNAPNAEMIREHAEQTGIPTNSVSQVARLLTQQWLNKLMIICNFYGLMLSNLLTLQVISNSSLY